MIDDSTFPASLCQLSRYALIAADGKDAGEFLQGQLTLDIGDVTPDHSRRGALLASNGRVIALIRALKCEGRLLLMLPAELAVGVKSHLARFVMRARVTLSIVTDDYRIHGITLADSAGESLPVPGAVDHVVTSDDGCLVRTRSAGPARLLGIFHSDRPGTLGGFAPAGPATAQGWHFDDIRAGQPEVYEATREKFIPQMVNLDLLDGLSFSKGCYVGQEIVARTQNLGRIKRRMLGFRSGSGRAPEPGDPIVTIDNPLGASAGHVVRAAAGQGGGFALLTVMSLSERGKAFMLKAGQTRLEPFALPYAIPELGGTG